MAYYLFQGAYASEALAALIKKPENRTEVVRVAVEKLGGKVVGSWTSLGEFDVVLIFEAPDNVTAAAFAVAVAAGGALRAAQTTPLFDPEDTLKIIRTAGKSGYRPPK